MLPALGLFASLFASIVSATPLPAEKRLVTRSTPAAPHWVVYSDDWVTGALPPVADIEGFNVFLLSFLLASGSVDQAQNWEELTAAQRSTALASYNAAGVEVMVSAFGSTDIPTSQDPTTTAQFVASWVQTYSMAGVDIDYEDFTGFDAGTGVSENWLITFTTELRSLLPEGEYVITHAPVAPWFSPSMWGGGGYLLVNEKVGSMIDWYNIQFYNQGATEYTTCAGLLTASSSAWPETALFQIAASGVTLDKLVIGKPAATNDASNGYIAPATLATCVQQAVGQGWDAGVMTWEYPDATSSWIESVRSLSYPVSGSPPPITTTSKPTSTTTTTSKPTSTSSSGACAGVAAWSSSVAYTGGEKVTYDGDLWTADYWTEANAPGGSAGVWTNDGAC